MEVSGQFQTAAPNKFAEAVMLLTYNWWCPVRMSAGHRLSWPWFLVILLSSSRKMSECTANWTMTGSCRFILQLIIH
jgi:hypothetical protein